MRRFFYITVMILLLNTGLVFCKDGLKKATFIPQWFPQAQFAGYYVAFEKGFYRNNGIDLKILCGGPDKPVSTWLRTGKTTFATLELSGAINDFERGYKIVNIAQILHKSGKMLIAKKSSRIKNISDMANKKVGIWYSPPQYDFLYLFKKSNINVNFVPQSYSVNLFLRNGVDVASAMIYNEYHVILQSGYNPEEIIIFPLVNYNLDFPQDGIYVEEKTLINDPEICRNFVKASKEGWEYAITHQDEAVRITLKYMKAEHIPANKNHQIWMIRKLLNLMLLKNDNEISINLSKDSFLKVASILKELGAIKKIPDYSKFFRPVMNDD